MFDLKQGFMDVSIITLIVSLISFFFSLFLIFLFLKFQKSKNQQIKELESELKEKETLIEQQNLRISELEAEIISQSQRIGELEKELESKLKEKEALIEQQNLKISELEAEITSQSQRIGELEKELESELKEKDALIEQQNLKISELEAEITSQSQRIGELEKELESELKEKDALIEQQNLKISELETEITSQSQRIDELEKELESELKKKDALIEQQNLKISELEDDISKKEEIIKSYQQKEKILSEIFNAEPLNNLNDNANKKISELEEFISKELIPRVDKYNLFENECERFEKIRLEFEKYKILNQRPLLPDKAIMVAFVGKYSVGKSSIINTIIGKERYIPVDLSPTTAVPTYIAYSYGINDEVYFEDFKGIIRKISLSAFSKIKEDFFRHIPLSDLIKYFIVYHTENALQNYIILDTPGITSKSDEDVKKSLTKLELWLSEVQNIFWVIDINEGTIDRYSLEILQRIGYKKNIFIVLNKVDTKSPGERKKILSNVMKLCKEKGITYLDLLEFSAKKEKEKHRNKMLEIFNKCNSSEGLSFELMLHNFFIELNERFTELYKLYKNDKYYMSKLEAQWQEIQKLEEKFKKIILSKNQKGGVT